MIPEKDKKLAKHLGITEYMVARDNHQTLTKGKKYKVLDWHEDMDGDKPGIIIKDDAGNRTGYFLERFKPYQPYYPVKEKK
jgi:hypothetical protein